MSKASVAQEPSMDEILASIRRIIETGDEKAAGSASREAAVGAARQIPAFLAGSPLKAVAERRADEPSASSEPVRLHPEPMAGAAFPGATGGDVDMLTAELETELAATWAHIEADREPAAAAAGATLQGNRNTNARSDAMSSDPDTRAFPDPAEAYAPHDGTEQHATASAGATHPTTSYEAPMERSAFEPANTDARASEEAATSRYGDTPPPLVSPATGQLVGASFNELAEAIRQGELRSLEAMAQEMLQPMLRDWLDDNLPKMVERLIREEIERLARGGPKR
ncbi:DUF2497 domain-containing protein [Aureimonas flava]|uniref:DUF2497 domain-containing protein n=1 Tax=Aureimonas flava TaxID=2320271 RepID=A0A3A1WS59_9HYPH|nr:DUF2497 domain-containing protein [Aureimonas flava]RIY03421.1 DUF2497 domain-containing protein [Aureimonas flava]